jgi:hypothetical protein
MLSETRGGDGTQERGSEKEIQVGAAAITTHRMPATGFNCSWLVRMLTTGVHAHDWCECAQLTRQAKTCTSVPLCSFGVYLTLL